jgi:hypothetical protein
VGEIPGVAGKISFSLPRLNVDLGRFEWREERRHPGIEEMNL